MPNHCRSHRHIEAYSRPFPSVRWLGVFLAGAPSVNKPYCSGLLGRPILRHYDCPPQQFRSELDCSGLLGRTTLRSGLGSARPGHCGSLFRSSRPDFIETCPDARPPQLPSRLFRLSGPDFIETGVPPPTPSALSPLFRPSRPDSIETSPQRQRFSRRRRIVPAFWVGLH